MSAVPAFAPISADTIHRALSFIPADDRDLWIRMGMAVKSELGDGGFALWDEWSQGAENYRAADARAVWRSFKGGGISIGSLLYEAKQRGFHVNGEDRRIDPAEIARYRKERAEALAKQQEQDAERYEAAALEAAEILDTATGDPSTHPYIVRKGGISLGPRVRRGPWPQRGWEDALLLPIYQADAKAWSIEAIPAEDGSDKDSLRGGKKTGGIFPIGKISGAPRIIIAEGAATAAACADATGLPAVAALTAGNLKDAARTVLKLSPKAEIIFAGDFDPKPNGKNPGKDAAIAAAKELGARVAIAELDGQACDFWDVWSKRGREAVKSALDGALHVQAEGTTPAPSVPAATNPAPSHDGAEMLAAVHSFLGRFVAYPSEHARVAHTLWIAHAHLMDVWESTPRIAFLSPEPGSGKTRALEITETLVPRPVEAVSATPAYLFRKVSDEAGAPTLLYDEIDTVFGPKAKDNEEIRGMLNAGHRRGAVSGRCVVRGKVVETEELPAYCAVALAGLDDLPDTIRSRAVLIKMRRRGPAEVVEPYRRRMHAPQGNTIRDRLATWAASVAESLRGKWPDMPGGIQDRDADVWEALLAVADAAGGAWPEMGRAAAVALVADAKQTPPSFGVRLLVDLRSIFGDQDAMHSADIVAALVAMDEAPWADMRGKPIDQRRLAKQLAKYGVKSDDVRISGKVAKGYKREWLHDAWTRYLGPSSPPQPPESATCATSATSDPDSDLLAEVAQDAG